MKDSVPGIDHGRPTLFFDVLGGDSVAGTKKKHKKKSENYKGDAQPTNLAALEEVLESRATDIQASGVRIKLYGRAQEIQAVLQEVRQRIQEQTQVSLDIDIVDCAHQTPMKSSDLVVGSSMDQMLTDAKDHRGVALSAGSTGALASGAVTKLRFDAHKGRPFIAKEIIEGVQFGDNGAIVKPKNAAVYQKMLNQLRECQEEERASRVMILPSDNFEIDEIKAALSESETPIEAFIDFCPEAEMGLHGLSKRPTEVLADGFIGNLHLKFIEALYKNKQGLKRLALIPGALEKVRSQFVSLNKTEAGWSRPQSLEIDSESTYGILSNGTEKTKGTPELQAFRQEMKSEGYKWRFIEPKEVLENPEMTILTTPAGKILAQSFFQNSFLRFLLMHPIEAVKLWRAGKQSVATAEVMNLKGQVRVMAAHGEVEVKETVKTLNFLLDMLLDMDKLEA